MELGVFVRARAVRLTMAMFVPIAAVLTAFTVSDGGKFRASARVAVPAPTLEGDPLVFAENLRALLQTKQVVATVASRLQMPSGDLRRGISARQVGRGSVVEVTYDGGATASMAARAMQLTVVEALRAAYSVELADEHSSVADRARSRLDVVADEAGRSTVSRPSERRRTAMAVAGAIGLVLAVVGLVITESVDATRR